MTEQKWNFEDRDGIARQLEEFEILAACEQAQLWAADIPALLMRRLLELRRDIASCPICAGCKRSAYSDATSPGFFFTECEQHRKQREELNAAKGQE